MMVAKTRITIIISAKNVVNKTAMLRIQPSVTVPTTLQLQISVFIKFNSVIKHVLTHL